MYAFESSGSRRGLHALVIGSLLGALVLFSIPSVPGAPVPIVFQFFGILCAGASVYFCTRYSLRLYRYAVEPNGIISADGEEQYDLVITELMGKKLKVVARVALRDIADVTVARRAEKITYQTVKETYGQGYTLFRYANRPLLPEECFIALNEGRSVVVIPYDEIMVGILTQNRMA